MKFKTTNRADNLKVALVQDTLIWGDVAQNLAHFTTVIRQIASTPDLIVLPEMFTSGFLMEKKHLVAPQLQETLNWMQQMATEKSTILMGSVIVEDAGKYYNRLYAVDQNGVLGYYNKRHLFRMGEEDAHFSAGTEHFIFNVKGWRICPLICYDLRFPVWSRNQNNYDVLIYVANWPDSRRKVWDVLLQARAIENQSYVVAVNRVGTDANNLEYSGGSMAINAKGKVIAKCIDNKSDVITAELNFAELNIFRKKFNVFADADKFECRI